MSAPLRVSYESPELLRAQFESEISLGGLFVPTVTNLEFRSAVRLVLDLDGFCDEEVELAAEVVSVVEPEMAGEGTEAGIAVQFVDSPQTLKAKLGGYIGMMVRDDRRRAPRRVARVPTLLETEDGVRLTGRSRDLSHSGVLLSIDGPPVAVGKRVQLTVEHPTFDERMTIPADVVRHVDVEGTVTALACMFCPHPDDAAEVVFFVDDIQASEHARRLRGVTGAIGELGITNVIQVFGGCTRSGTLTVIRGYEEGRIVFEDGMLREVRLGPVSGMKALARIVSWRDGSFEFHARVESSFGAVEPCPLDGALLEATRQHDEQEHLGLPPFAPTTRFFVNRERLDAERGELSKLEDSVVELVCAGMSLRQLLDVIPEADVDVLRALSTLIDLGLITSRS